MKSTKKSLLSAVLALIVCVSLLVGTTFAWFTDSVTSANNIIKSGNLDIELEYWDGADWVDVKGKSDILTNELWEPGVTEVAYLRVANAGSLAFKYQLGINIDKDSEIAGVNAAGETFKLSDHIHFGVVEDIAVSGNEKAPAAYDTREEAVAAVTNAQIISKGYTKASPMLSGEELYLALVVYMPTTVGNEANHNGVNVPAIDLGINVLASQMTSEYDSFGNDYDANAGGSYELAFGFNNEKDLLSFAPTEGNAASSGLRLEDGKAVVEGSGAWFTADTNLAIKDTCISYQLDITDLEDGKIIIVDTGDKSTWNSTPIAIERGSAKVYYGTAKNEYIGTLEGTELTVSHTYKKDADNNLEITTVVSDGNDAITFSKSFAADNKTTLYWDIFSVEQSGVVTVDDFTFVQKMAEIKTGEQLVELFADAKDGGTITMPQSFNTTNAPLAEAIEIDGDITVNPNGMYLVSAAPATFTVAEGGKLTVEEGSFTIKNTATNGAAVVVDGGEFEMAGGSFDAHTAVRTTEGKSSTVTLSAGWSNRVTVAFDSKGNDTINVTGGSIYSSAESIKTTAGNNVTINISGGLLSSKTSQYSAAVNLQCPATVNMTGGKIENTYSSGYNGSSAIEANVAPTTINLSGSAALSSNGVAVMLGSHWESPAVLSERIKLNLSGDASINATSAMGFGIRYAQDACDVTISGNAKVNATYQAIQFNTNNYVYTNSTLVVSENARITSTAGRIGGGYAIASNGHVTVTGGTISGSTAGIASFQEGAVVIVDNSKSGTPITINKVDIAEGVSYTVKGNPTIG